LLIASTASLDNFSSLSYNIFSIFCVAGESMTVFGGFDCFAFSSSFSSSSSCGPDDGGPDDGGPDDGGPDDGGPDGGGLDGGGGGPDGGRLDGGGGGLDGGGRDRDDCNCGRDCCGGDGVSGSGYRCCC
jgi:hypothetical protein